MKQPPGLNAFIRQTIATLDAAEEGYDEDFLDDLAIRCRPFYRKRWFDVMADYNTKRQMRIYAHSHRPDGPDEMKAFVPLIRRTATGGFDVSDPARVHKNRASDEVLDLYADFVEAHGRGDLIEATLTRRFKASRSRRRRKSKP